VTCGADWWDAQQDDPTVEFNDDGGFCGEYLSPRWWRRPWPIYWEDADAEVLPDIATWNGASLAA